MNLGVKVGKSKVSKKGQTSLSITLPRQVVENLKIKKGDIVDFFQNPEFGSDVLILVVRRNGDSDATSGRTDTG